MSRTAGFSEMATAGFSEMATAGFSEMATAGQAEMANGVPNGGTGEPSPAETGAGTAKTRSKRVRPYSLTGGRTHTQQQLLVETLISTPQYDPSLSDSLMPESRALYERARGQASIAELSVEFGLPLGVIRVLIGDLASRGAVFVHPTAHAYQNDPHVLERILDGLKRLPA